MVCDVCNVHQAIGVAAVPCVPMSAAYCITCLAVGADPYWALVANTTCCGGLEHTHADWQGMVTRTCAYLGIPLEQFHREVAEAITIDDDIDNY